jgi:hypothetical protein
MQATRNTHLKFVDFTHLVSWSSYALLGKNLIYTQKYSFVRIGEFLKRNKEQVQIEDGVLYKRPTIRINGNGISLRDEIDGKNIGTKNQFRIYKDQFLLSKIDARNGAFGVVPQELDKGIITGNFWTFDVDYNLINPHYLTLLTGTKEFQKLCQTASVGTTNRNYLQEDLFLNFEIPLPKLTEQENFLSNYNNKIKQANKLAKQTIELEHEIETYLYESLGLLKKKANKTKNNSLQTIEFDSIQEWGLDKILSSSVKKSSKFTLVSIEEKPFLVVNLFRGKSPMYKDDSNKFILNQKCNRWNEIDMSYVKFVDEHWLKSVDNNNLTKEGDVLINSTGEGTIGRATYIKKENEGLLYDSHLLLLRFDKTKVNAELFVEIFNSEYGQNQVNDIKSAQATKQTELGTSNLAKIQFPLIEDLTTQNKIIAKIKALRANRRLLLDKSLELTKNAIQEFENAIFSSL